MPALEAAFLFVPPIFLICLLLLNEKIYCFPQINLLLFSKNVFMYFGFSHTFHRTHVYLSHYTFN